MKFAACVKRHVRVDGGMAVGFRLEFRVRISEVDARLCIRAASAPRVVAGLIQARYARYVSVAVSKAGAHGRLSVALGIQARPPRGSK